MTVARPFKVFVFAWLFLGASCHKGTRVEFPRPPASMPEPEKASEPSHEATPPAEESAPPPEASAPEPPAVRPTPRDPTTAPPTPEPQPSRASRSTPPREDVPAIQDKIRRAELILESVSARSLTQPEREQVLSARTFIVQAKDALSAGDPRRAAVLADKGFILAQDVERTSRP